MTRHCKEHSKASYRTNLPTANKTADTLDLTQWIWKVSASNISKHSSFYLKAAFLTENTRDLPQSFP